MSIKKIFFTLIFFSYLAFSQKSSSPFDTDKLLQEEVINKLSTDKLMQSGQFPVGNPVDPDFYYVGPGDKLSLINITISSNQEILEITPEFLVVIPRIGMFDVKGMTLTKVKELIKSEISKRNSNSLPSVSLYQARNIMISIDGNFQFPGTYTLPASYTVNTALKIIVTSATNNMMSNQLFSLSYNKKQNKRLNDIQSYAETGIPLKQQTNYRNLIIFHSDGTSSIADLEYGVAYQDYKLNPYIKEGDKIVVPSDTKDFSSISITGGVNNPTTIQFKKGDKAGLLMKLSGGIQPDISNDDIIIYHNDGSKVKYNENELLKPGTVIIAKKPDSNNDEKSGIVSVIGNVNKPGTFAINSENNTLKNIIENAGGFNSKAYLPLAYLVRKDSKVIEEFNSMDNKDFTDIFQYSDLTLEDTVRLKNDIFNKKPVVSCDFVALFKKNDMNHNITLQDGDLIVIPSKPNSVYVFGQVNLPGSIPFQENKSLSWYLERAGGTAKGAKESRIRVIKAKTKVWVEAEKEYIVEAGDYVYVPRSPDNPPGTDIQTYNLIVTSIFALVSVLNFIVPFVK
jgi:polysaccharide export outer membrane protein